MCAKTQVTTNLDNIFFESSILFTVFKVRSLLEHSCAILISFKIVVIFNTTSAKSKSADVILKMTTILKEMRIAQLYSKSELTLAHFEATIFRLS